MKFIAQPDGVYIADINGGNVLIPGVAWSRAGGVRVDAIAVEIAIDGVVVDGAVALRVVDGVQLVVLDDGSEHDVAKVIDAARESGAARVPADKIRSRSKIDEATEGRR